MSEIKLILEVNAIIAEPLILIYDVLRGDIDTDIHHTSVLDALLFLLDNIEDTELVANHNLSEKNRKRLAAIIEARHTQ
jgi:hypothetical protein